MSLEAKVKDLKTMELFKDFSETQLTLIAANFTKHKYKRSEMIYSSEALANKFIFVLSGEIKIFRLSESGKEQIIRQISAGEFTGELALFEDVRKAYAEALAASELYFVDHKVFKLMLIENPKLALKMIEILVYRLALSEEQTASLSTSSAKERLWTYLNKEAKWKNKKYIVSINQTKRFLAAYLGMTSETLSRSLHQLEVENKIKDNSDFIEIIV